MSRGTPAPETSGCLLLFGGASLARPADYMYAARPLPDASARGNLPVGEGFPSVMPRLSRIAAGVAIVFASCLPLRADGPAPAIPDERAFLEEVRQNLKSDESLLEQYTFTEKYTERKLSSKG